MKTRKSGFVLFIIGSVYIIGMAFVASWWARPAYHYMSWNEVNRTIWAVTSPLFGLWASSAPVGAIVAGIGILIHVRSKGARVWFFAIGALAVVALDILSRWGILPQPAHVPPLFGIGGGLITAFFLTILWLWSKRRVTLDGTEKAAADLQLIGYVFFLIAMWYLCGNLSRPYQQALADRPLTSPVPTIVYLVLGWLFFFLSHLKSARGVLRRHDSGTPE